MPRVSIVTPSYNQAPFLDATIRSVLEQDYPNIEYIICDGGSTDGSVDIIRSYEGRLAWWCSEKDSGQSEAINKGLLRATGDIVAWLNSDDLYLNHAISKIVNGFQVSPDATLIYGDLQVIDEHSRIIGKHPAKPYIFTEQLTHKSIIPQPAAFWRRKVLDDVGLLREDLHYAMDYEYWVRIGLRFPIVYYPSLLAQFRVAGTNKSSAQSIKWRAEIFRILDELYSRSDLPISALKAKNAAYAGANWIGATTAVTALEMKSAQKHLWAAAQLNPHYLFTRAWWACLAKILIGKKVNLWGRAIKVRLRNALSNS
jgi:glycosyltransferase involved in cell wall biosynthesis